MSEVVMDQIRKHPVLAEFCAPLPRLTESDDPDLSRSISRFGELLRTHPRQVSLGFRITGDVARYWRLFVDPAGFTTAEEPAENGDVAQPDIEVIVGEQTWRSLAEGGLSPMAALFAGQLRFRGDVALAWRVVRQLRRAGAAESGKE